MSNSPMQGEAVQKQAATSQTMLRVVAGLLIILIALVGFGIYKLSTTNTTSTKPTQNQEQTNNQNNPNNMQAQNSAQTNNPTNTPTQSAQPAAQNQVPAGWKPMKMPKYHYTAYRPSGYYYRFFDNGKVLGIDPNQIPEASEYLGVVTLEVTTGNLEDVKMEHIKDWMAIATHQKVEKNATWDLVKGTIPGDEMMPEQEAIMAITKKGNYVYIVDYRANKGHFADYEKVFDQFYPAILFE